jgi:peptide/nickel transport system permease protein
MSIFRYILRRALLAIPLLLGITLIAFAISQFVPSDPVVANLGQSAMSDPEIVAAFRAEWGLDKPIHEQYFTYLGNLLQGDLGRSIKSRRPVMEDLRDYLPATIELATTATIIGTAVGILFGVISAVRRNALIDMAVRTVSLIGVSLPVFWLALVALQIFYARLGWFPGPGRLDIGMKGPPDVTGMVTIDALIAGDWASLRSGLRHLMLPAIVLSAFTVGLVTRVTRSAMLEVLSLEYIRTAYAKGLQERLVVLRHALRNALIPVVTVVGFSYGNLLAGTVLTETIFAWPGIGWYAYRASTSLDFPAIMGVSMVIALIFVLTNLVVDVLYFVLDPRLRTAN